MSSRTEPPCQLSPAYSAERDEVLDGRYLLLGDNVVPWHADANNYKFQVKLTG